MNIDEMLTEAMNIFFRKMKEIDPSVPDSEVRCQIVSANLTSLAYAILDVDEQNLNEEWDFKKTALGLLTTADWLKGDD